VFGIRYYLWFHVTTVGLGTYYLWIQGHCCTVNIWHHSRYLKAIRQVLLYIMRVTAGLTQGDQTDKRFGFAKQSCCTLKSSEMWCCAAGRVLPNAGGGLKCLSNVGNYRPTDSATFQKAHIWWHHKHSSNTTMYKHVTICLTPHNATNCCYIHTRFKIFIFTVQLRYCTLTSQNLQPNTVKPA
jgi:hypothetical protein